MKILVPVDGSKYSMEAVKVALKYAKATTTDISIITVTPFISGLDLEISAKKMAMLTEDLKKRAEDVLEKAKGILKAEKVSARTILSSAASAAEEIIREAEKEKADLIIIGNRGLGGKATRFFMGSVAAKVATHAPCSVYIVKTPD
jgi:nucleotide-binding universal stress UspA family protein